MNIKSLAILLFCVNIGCSLSQEKAEQKPDFLVPEYKRVDYKVAIDTIEKKVVDLTAPSDLFGVKEFMGIYMYAEMYIQESLVYITDSSNSKQKRMIAAYSMQHLSDSLYIDFCKSAAAMLGHDIISTDLLATILFDSINDKYQIIRNYKDSTVFTFLEKVKSGISDDELRNRIDNVIAGKTWRGIKIFLEENR